MVRFPENLLHISSFEISYFFIFSLPPANQFKINLMFTGSRLPLYTYGALQIKLINHDGINETFTLTRYHFSAVCLLPTAGLSLVAAELALPP